MADKKQIVSWVLAALGAAVFFFAGFSKATGMPIVDMLHENIGLPTVMARIIGVVEVIGAVALLVPKSRWFAAEALTGMMLVAFLWHVIAQDWAGFFAPLIPAAFVGPLAWIDRPDWFRQKFF